MSAQRREAKALLPRCPSSQEPSGLEVPREGRTRSHSPTCRVPSQLLGHAQLCTTPSVPEGRAGEVALGDPCTLLPEFLPQRRRDHKARDCPSLKGRVSLGQRVCRWSSHTVPSQVSGCSWSWGPGRGPWRSLSAHILSLAPWQLRWISTSLQSAGSSGHPGQNGSQPVGGLILQARV